jgi:hypothetical protein
MAPRSNNPSIEMAESTPQNQIIYPLDYIVLMTEEVYSYFHQVDHSQLSKRKEPETPMDPEDEQESKRSKYRK